MESIKLIRDELAQIKSLSDTVLLRALKDRDEFARTRIEIDKLNSIIDELRDENANMQSGFEAMIKRSGLDVSPCRDCGEVVVCIPDGLALCKTCAAKGGEA